MSNTDKKQLVKLLSYMSTFDGGLYRKGKGNARFIMNMREENRDYVEWVQETLEEITGTVLGNRKDYNTDGYKRKPQLRLESRNHPFLTKLHTRIYMDGHKVIDPHMLRLMDEEALAIIFMANGCVKEEKRFKNPRCYVELSTKGFSYADNLALGRAIYEETGVHTKVNRHHQYYFLAIPKKSHKVFYEAVVPYVLPSFQYKLERMAPSL